MNFSLLFPTVALIASTSMVGKPGALISCRKEALGTGKVEKKPTFQISIDRSSKAVSLKNLQTANELPYHYLLKKIAQNDFQYTFKGASMYQEGSQALIPMPRDEKMLVGADHGHELVIRKTLIDSPTSTNRNGNGPLESASLIENDRGHIVAVYKCTIGN
jgi:hypothetical protein